MLTTAKTILGYDIEQLCLEGPTDKLNLTEYAQPALLIADLAAVELLKHTHPKVAGRVSAVAGLSLGEYAALCFAGVLSFEDTLRLVKVRAEVMAQAAQLGDAQQGMLSVVGLSDAVLQGICNEVKRGEDDVCEIANKVRVFGFVVGVLVVLV